MAEGFQVFLQLWEVKHWKSSVAYPLYNGEQKLPSSQLKELYVTIYQQM